MEEKTFQNRMRELREYYIRMQELMKEKGVVGNIRREEITNGENE